MTTQVTWSQLFGASVLLFAFDMVQWSADLFGTHGSSRSSIDSGHAISTGLVFVHEVSFAALVLFILLAAAGLYELIRDRSGRPMLAQALVALFWAVPISLYFSAGKGLLAIAPRWVSLPVMLALTVVGSIVAFRVGCWLVDWMQSGVSPGRTVLCIGLLVAALVLFYADISFLWGLYYPLHFLLSAAGVITAMVALVCARQLVCRQWGRVRLEWLAGLAGVGLVISLAAPAWVPLAHTRAVLSGIGARHNAVIANSAASWWPSDSAEPSPGGSPATETAALPRLGEQPHVLVISIDGVRASHVGFLGAARDTTPFLDGLAPESLVFTRAYSSSANTHNTLNDVLTNGALEPLDALPGADFMGLCPSPLPAQTLPQTYGNAGYKTVCDFIYTQTKLACAAVGCEVRRNTGDREATLEMLVRHVGTSSRPVFGFAHLLETHAPYRGFDQDIIAQTPGWSSYERSVRGMDRSLRGFFEKINEVATRPVIWVLMSDHGEALGEHGHETHYSSVFEEQVQVPLMIYGPGIAPGRVSTPVSTKWLHGTLRTLVGESAQGPSLPLEPEGTSERPVFVRSPVFVRNKSWYGVVDGRWKYIELRDIGARWLFDLESDPDEMINLLGEHPERARRLETLVDRRFPAR